MLEEPVLLLNSTFEPLNVINVKRAAQLVLLEKAQMVEHNAKVLRAARVRLPLPLVVRLNYYIHRPFQKVKFTKRAVFQRDGYRCQYCARRDGALTIDHVQPRSAGGVSSWTNVVTACKDCNNRKGNRPPAEAQMALLARPREPKLIPYLRITRRVSHRCWEKYLFYDFQESGAADLMMVAS